ncbi:MAG: PQQ-dependent sugar dehydrogenase [Geminicoccaceae bacterium]|nr:PQQ-dependent sugar dehydrogenase [Geminicoccaceae bacterium]MDW8342468.1 PQQ-dependent sugar dehydrogenase [Geminicoccaceae bacterium]
MGRGSAKTNECSGARRKRPSAFRVGLTAAALFLGALSVPVGAAREPSRSPPLALELVAEGFAAPIDLLSLPDGSGRAVVVDQRGVVFLLEGDGRLRDIPFLDLRDKLVFLARGFEERGLLGLAFHPEFARNGRLFATYTAPLAPGAPAGWNHTRRLSEFTTAGARDRVDPASERVLLELPWPSRKHLGGGLAFGPDGYLYVGLGDGGGVHGVGPEVLYEAFEVPPELAHWDRLAQDPWSLYGKILRLDVDRGFPSYAVPPLNPLANGLGRPEIWAWGFRQPWRLSFDGTDLFVSAVGETLWEAIYLVDRPGNYGWAIREGRHCFDRSRPKNPPPSCPRHGPFGEPLRDPIVEYPNTAVGLPGVALGREGIGTATVGGHVYRGSAIPALSGKLVFGDWSRSFREPSGQIFVATPPAVWGALWSIEKVLELDARVLGLGRDAEGELYVLSNAELGPHGRTGKVWKLVPRG